MGPIKRKSDGAEVPPKRQKTSKPSTHTHEHRPQKAKERDGDKAKTAKLDKSTAGRGDASVQGSLLKDEERAFPRGGASVLTPLEHKQIRNEATRDALFEQEGQAKDGVEAGEDGEDAIVKQPVDIAVKKRKTKGRMDTAAAQATEPHVRVEGLSYKRLVPGSIVLGQVSRISANDISITLPNNLTGFIPLTAISDKVDEKIQRILAEDEGASDEAAEKGQEQGMDADDINLTAYFTIGQYLRAYVTSSLDEDGSAVLSKSKKRITLSVKPQHTNSGLSKSDLVVNSMVQASVKSVEDHGLIMDLGLEDASIKGFMSSKELGHTADHTKVQEGTVLLCLVTGLSSNGKIVKLSADHAKAGNIKKGNYLTEGPTVDAFLPGTAVEMLITEIAPKGVIGQVMGMLATTADIIHSGAGESSKTLDSRFKIGQKVKARIISTFPDSSPRKIGVSLLDHVLSLSHRLLRDDDTMLKSPLDELPLSAIVEQARVVKVIAGLGLFMDTGVKSVPGFVHISRVTDGKIETLSESTGAYKVGSVHKARVVGYNAMDGLFLLSLENKVLEQPFLRVEDLTVGKIVKGKVEKLVLNARGVGGVLVNLAEGITGLVPEMHMADVHLQHPEKKFREGVPVTARVLSTDADKHQIRLTLKKALVNSETRPWTSYDHITPGSQSLGTLVNIIPQGAVVQFYGNVRAFLPVSEMSEAYIHDPSQHFRVGQVVHVHVLSVDGSNGRMIVSCRDQSSFGSDRQQAFEAISLGDRVSGVITEKSDDDVTLEVTGSGLRAILKLGHLTDGTEQKEVSTMNRLRVGQSLQDLVVLEKLEKKPVIYVTNKPSLLKAAQTATLIKRFEDVQEGMVTKGFVRNITPEGIFVQFAGRIIGLLPRSHISEELSRLPEFGLRKLQSITANVLSVDYQQQRFLLSMKHGGKSAEQTAATARPQTATVAEVTHPVDGQSNSITDFTIGKVTKTRIISVKDTQLNVELADNLQGRIDVSEVFNDWDEIRDRKHPLRKFKPKQVLDVRILGVHDARNHRFLPITHREGRKPVFELSMKGLGKSTSDLYMLTLDKVKPGTSWIAFVNNTADNCLWVNLSPNIRGRLELMDISEDLSLLTDLEKNFPIGSAMQVHVKNVDIESNRLDLSAIPESASAKPTIQSLTQGMVLPGRITKVTERSIFVQLSDTLSGPVPLTELTDDYEQANPTTYKKNEIVRVCIVDIDGSNKRIVLSTRPSKVLSSSLPVKDPHIATVEQLKVNDVVRGFVKNVSDKGLFISLGPSVTAFVRVSDLSDSFIKDWKSSFEIDQLVTGKVVSVDPAVNHIQMSLKRSVIDEDYVPQITFNDITEGQIITGKVRKVEQFGVFIVVDGSANVSGLCHRSELADQKVEDATKLYNEGDAVKAVVLKVDPEKRRVSFGLKASYFKDTLDSDGSSDASNISDEDADMDTGGVQLMINEDVNAQNDSDMPDDNLATEEIKDFDGSDMDNDGDDKMDVEDSAVGAVSEGLATGGFTWDGTIPMENDVGVRSASETDDEGAPKKKKRRKPEIKVDKTGDLDRLGPQSVADFERQLLGQPNSSSLWVQYMAFQLQLGEVGKARDIAERALKTINIREEEEKMDVWIALLNLENTYGSEEAVEEVFKRACQYNDPQEMHDRLASIYIESGRHQQADTLFQTMTKNKAFTPSPSLWLNYAHFLFTTLSAPQRARSLLPRAMQSVPSQQHLALTAKFAALEFRSPNGDPERGRTMFEGLVTTWPKRWDLWDQWTDLENSLLERDRGDRGHVRALYERMSGMKMKSRRAKYVFKRWLEWEEREGGARDVERVKAKAKEYVAKRKEGEE